MLLTSSIGGMCSLLFNKAMLWAEGFSPHLPILKNHVFEGGNPKIKWSVQNCLISNPVVTGWVHVLPDCVCVQAYVSIHSKMTPLFHKGDYPIFAYGNTQHMKHKNWLKTRKHKCLWNSHALCKMVCTVWTVQKHRQCKGMWLLLLPSCHLCHHC